MKPTYPIVPHSTKKRPVINGVAYRMRRGKLVEIPAEWVGQTTYDQTIHKRRVKPAKKKARHQRLRKHL